MVYLSKGYQVLFYWKSYFLQITCQTTELTDGLMCIMQVLDIIGIEYCHIIFKLEVWTTAFRARK